MKKVFFILPIFILLTACTSSESEQEFIDFSSSYPNFYQAFSQTIDFENVYSYEGQAIPSYIREDNTTDNPISNSGALLGRILFYDQNLSSNNTVSCSSCHIQASAFGDLASVSQGANGLTGRHSMRLINSRFSRDETFFWDERASTLEQQTTQPIQDHNEMGFSGSGGDPSLNDLVIRLSDIPYYQDLFTYAFGSSEITENKIQRALAQFIRSIQSFDSPYDVGRALAGNDNSNFPNFTPDQNAGKELFMNSRNNGGADCASCHSPPEFDIRPNSGNNGVIGVFGSASLDLTVTRSPSIRDIASPSGILNGPLMHDASISSLQDLVEHYNSGITDNVGLDNRLRQGGGVQSLGLSTTEKNQLVEFLKTLSGSDVYINEKWSSPF